MLADVLAMVWPISFCIDSTLFCFESNAAAHGSFCAGDAAVSPRMLFTSCSVFDVAEDGGIAEMSVVEDGAHGSFWMGGGAKAAKI